MTRVEAREFMMQVFFQMEACGDFDVNSRADFMNQEKIRDQREYCNELHSLLCNKKNEVDDLLRKYSTKWKIERMPKTELRIRGNMSTAFWEESQMNWQQSPLSVTKPQNP